MRTPAEELGHFVRRGGRFWSAKNSGSPSIIARFEDLKRPLVIGAIDMLRIIGPQHVLAWITPN